MLRKRQQINSPKSSLKKSSYSVVKGNPVKVTQNWKNSAEDPPFQFFVTQYELKLARTGLRSSRFPSFGQN